jgi:hypothetical protein
VVEGDDWGNEEGENCRESTQWANCPGHRGSRIRPQDGVLSWRSGRWPWWKHGPKLHGQGSGAEVWTRGLFFWGGEPGDRRSVIGRIVSTKSDIVGDIVEFLSGDLVKLFALLGQFFVNFHGFFGHFLVGFLGATDQGEVGSLGHPLMAIGVQPDAEKESPGFCGGFLRR